MTNIAVNLREAAAMYPDADALTLGERTVTFRAFDESASRVAAFLHAGGIGPGDRVGLMLPNVPAFAVLYYGILRAGAVVVPMNPLQSAREVDFFLSNTDARLLFSHPDQASAAHAGAASAGVPVCVVDDDGLAVLTEHQAPVRDSVVRDDDDTAVILHTSGTTGVPKGAELTHGNLQKNQAVAARQVIGSGPDDVILACLPLFHAFGMTCALNVAVATGANLVMLPRFTGEDTLDLIAHRRVTVFAGVPTMYSAMLHAAGEWNTGSLRICLSGGAAMPRELLRGFEERFGCIVLEGYGLSETSPLACFNLPDRERKIGSIGIPIEGVQMRVVDDRGVPVASGVAGEIQIRGHNVMKGYWGLPEATAHTITDGWLATGDIGRTDDDGYFYVVDRKKALIIRGGYNVYPSEIEDVLYAHPAVAAAAVVGLPHESLGEEVGAAVVLKSGSHATPHELRAFVKGQVAAYKYPRKVWIADTLPMSATGKILRREVRPPADMSPA